MTRSLAVFEHQVLEAFGTLICEFGLLHTRSVFHAPEFSVTFENDTTAVDVTFEVGTGPIVTISSLKMKDGYDLSFFVAERIGREIAFVRLVEIDDSALPGRLKALATDLREYGSDALRGDFTVFPRLRVRAVENLRRAQRELYGTER